MNEEQLIAVYEELLDDTRKTIKTIMKLMESQNENVMVFAVEAFINLSDRARILTDVLDEPPRGISKNEKNPLARRARIKEHKM